MGPYVGFAYTVATNDKENRDADGAECYREAQESKQCIEAVEWFMGGRVLSKSDPKDFASMQIGNEKRGKPPPSVDSLAGLSAGLHHVGLPNRRRYMLL